MSINKIVLVLGLLCGMNSGLNAVKPEHEVRMQQIDTEIQLLMKQIDAMEDNEALDDAAEEVEDTLYVSKMNQLVTLWQEALTYLEDKDYLLKHSIEWLIAIANDLVEIEECL